MAESASIKGLVLTGELRNVRRDTVKPDRGASFQQLVLVVDDGSDYIQRVVVPQNVEAQVEATAAKLVGQTVSLSVYLGHYRRLWFSGFAS